MPLHFTIYVMGQFFEKWNVLFTISLLASSSPTFCFQEPPLATVKVMTQNLYIGADVATLAKAKFEWLVPLMVSRLFKNVKNSKFSLRAKAIASEIRRTQPDLVALQEVTLLMRQSPGDFNSPNPTPATKVVLDYLKILMNALEDEGLEYDVASENRTSDIELPFISLRGVLHDLRAIDRDVILKKRGISTRDPREFHFKDALTIKVKDNIVRVSRGYNSVIATISGREFKFVNLHLEIEDYMIQYPQAAELVANLTAEAEKDGLPIILVGDLNSEPTSPPLSPYDTMRNGGFLDAWELQDSLESGNTCCHKSLKSKKARLTRRIDHVWLLFPSQSVYEAIKSVKISLFGNQPSHKTQGLWPSDHAGISTELLVSSDAFFKTKSNSP